ncbi:hypothetical protein AA14362_0333 [Acetobacter cerevisiae DSM 14362]|nr:hypothetical protein AA14362_0333 [Acetobacter cerevisiae DSM 14362]
MARHLWRILGMLTGGLDLKSMASCLACNSVLCCMRQLSGTATPKEVVFSESALNAAAITPEYPRWFLY